MAGSELTLALALGAGLISFLSPCVLPLVPAYLGQLTAVAVAGKAAGTPPSRWIAIRHALAYVAGFGVVFTLLGITATYAASGLSPYLTQLRQLGGIVLIVLGLSLAGILRIPVLERTWRPLDAGAMGSLATATGSVALAAPGGSSGGFGRRLGGRMVDERGGLAAAFGLGAIFAIGWTPCIGPILAAILAVAASETTVAKGAGLLAVYSLGLGVPFLLAAFAVEPFARFLTRFRRHLVHVERVMGGLLILTGVAFLTGSITTFSFWLLETFPALGRIG